MNKKGILLGIFGQALLLDGQIWAMHKSVNTDQNLNSDRSPACNSSQNSNLPSKFRKQAEKWKKKKNNYLRDLKESNLQLVKEVKSLAAEVQQMRSMLSRKFPDTSNMGVQAYPEYSDIGVQLGMFLEKNPNIFFNTGTQTHCDRSHIGTQSLRENASNNERRLVAAFSENPPSNIKFSDTSDSESEDQNEQLSDMINDEENSNINPSSNDISKKELTFLEKHLDTIQVGEIVGSVGTQFRTTQLDATILCTDKDPDDPNYFDSMHYYSLKIFGINGSDERPGSVSFGRMTIGGTDGHVYDIRSEQDLSRILISLVMSAISGRPDLEYLRAGLCEVDVKV